MKKTSNTALKKHLHISLLCCVLLVITLLITACNEYVETPLPEDITSEHQFSIEPAPEYPPESVSIPKLLAPQHNTLCVSSEGPSLAIMLDGTLWVWEDNTYSQLDTGSVPVQVGIDADWVSVASGWLFTIALKDDGTLWTWEWEYGEFAEKAEPSYLKQLYSNPVQVGTSANWASIVASQWHIVAIKTDGTLWAWGLNCDGQLGNGDIAEVGLRHILENRILEPIQIGTDTDWARVSANRSGTMALKTDGTLWAWGRVASWFGDGRAWSRYTPPQTTPLQIGTDTDWVAASAGNANTFALKSDGSLWAWGNNPRDWLGVDSLDEIIVTPMQIGTDTDWINAATGFNRAALRADGSLWSWDLERDENGYPANGVRLIMIIAPVGEDL